MSETSREETDRNGDGQPALGAPSWVVLAMMALVPPLFANGFSNFEALKEVAFVGGSGVALMLWAVGVWRQRAISMVAGRAVTLALLFGAYVVVASLWADNALLGLWEALNLASLSAVVLIVSAPVGRPLRFRELALAVGAGAGLSGLMGVLDLVGVGVFTVIWDPPGATGAFDAMEFATAYYAVALPSLLAATFRFSGWLRALSIAAILLAGFHFGLVAGWEMAALFAGACAVAAVIAILLQREIAQLVLIPVMVLLGAIGVFVAVGQWTFDEPAETSDATSLPHLKPPEFAERDAGSKSEVRNIVFAPDRTESVRDWEAHDYLLETTTALFAEQPIVGHGAGAWWPLQTRQVDIEHPYVSDWFDTYPAFRSPHNGASKLMVEYGLVGVSLFALFLASAIGVSVAAMSGPGEREESILEQWALLATALAGLIFLFITPLLELAPAALTWFAALALSLRVAGVLSGFHGWSSRWAVGASEKSGPFNPVTLNAASAAVVGAGLLVVASLNFGAGYYRGQADHLMLRTVYGDAIDRYRDSLEWYPAFGDAQLNIAIAGSRSGRHEDVREAVERAAKMRPYDVRALVSRGRIALSEGHEPDALEYAQRAVDAFPNSLSARKLLVSVRDMRGEYEEAIEAARELLDQNPPQAHQLQLHLAIGDLYFDMLDDFDNAREHYEKALDLIETPQRKAQLQDKIEEVEQKLEDAERMEEGKPPVHEQPGGGDGHGH